MLIVAVEVASDCRMDENFLKTTPEIETNLSA